VTGANGFIGRHVVAALQGAGHEVRALVRPSASVEGLGWGDRVEIARADLRGAGDLAAACAGVDAVVHVAARMGGGEAEQFETTVVGTERLLAALVTAGGARVVLAGSYAVYDWSRIEDRLTEESPVVAGNMARRGPYTVAKAWQERVARRMADEAGLALTVLRPGFVWGRGHVVLSGMGRRYGGLWVVLGRSTALPLTYVENCAEAFVAAAEAREAAGETFNVVDDERVTAWRYTAEYLARTGTGGRLVSVPYPLALGASRLAATLASRVLADGGDLPDILVPERLEAQFKPLEFPNAKARSQLGWTPRVGFDEALARSYGEAPGP
jgi:UDP-glucose 4-epimerase